MYLQSFTLILYTIFMTQSEALLELLETEKVIRPRDLANDGISRITLYALQRQGKIEQSGRGVLHGAWGMRRGVCIIHCRSQQACAAWHRLSDFGFELS